MGNRGNNEETDKKFLTFKLPDGRKVIVHRPMQDKVPPSINIIVDTPEGPQPLYKYAPKELQQTTLSPSENDELLYGFTEFQRTHESPLKSGIFLTWNNFSDPVVAQKYLAVTYKPMLKYHVHFRQDEKPQDPILQFRNYENESVISGPPFDPEGIRLSHHSFSRVWPAFGYHGGAWEIVRTRGTLTYKDPDFIFKGNPRYDYYQMDSTDEYLQGIAQILYFFTSCGLSATFWNQEERNLDSPLIKVSVISTAYCFLLPHVRGTFDCGDGEMASIRAALSCSYNVEENNILFWGSLWADCEQKRLRYLYSLERETYQVESSIAAIKELQTFFPEMIERIPIQHMSPPSYSTLVMDEERAVLHEILKTISERIDEKLQDKTIKLKLQRRDIYLLLKDIYQIMILFTTLKEKLDQSSEFFKNSSVMGDKIEKVPLP